MTDGPLFTIQLEIVKDDGVVNSAALLLTLSSKMPHGSRSEPIWDVG